MREQSVWARLRAVVVGHPRDLGDRTLFHKVSLIAVLAWVGLGADGLSSSCYGPEETYKALGQYTGLAPIIAVMCVLTITIICVSYRQIIELFPSGGGGYLVASKLLSPKAGLISGCALLVDYVLTITISIASGADALFSLLPVEYQDWKVIFASCVIGVLMLLNLRGVRESVTLFAPVFFLFVITHAIAIFVAFAVHLADIGAVVERTGQQIGEAHSSLGLLGIAALLLRAFSVGAGTYTGIEAVSNGLPILRDPKVQTGKLTMTLMGISLAVTVFGLLLTYLLENVSPVAGKTLNAVLFESITANWPLGMGYWFVLVSMLSAMALLFIAAQAGFLDGPRVLANMAIDRWFPTRFAMLSDRFVTQNGVLLMGTAALIALLATGGKVGILVVLYSINVFLTFSLSQLGMCNHWWSSRSTVPQWKSKLAINGLGLLVTSFILVTLSIEKFHEGGWVTLVVTLVVVVVAILIRRHYDAAGLMMGQLSKLVDSAQRVIDGPATIAPPNAGRVAIVLVNGFNGLGLNTLYGVFRMFPNTFGRFVFVQVGTIDAGSFKGQIELDALRQTTKASVEKFAQLCKSMGLEAETQFDVGIDSVDAIDGLCRRVLTIYPDAVIFGGQLAFQQETVITRLLHNSIVFALQRLFCRDGIPFVIVPARV